MMFWILLILTVTAVFGQKEYEEVRNAELIEAQRLEAAEIRRK